MGKGDQMHDVHSVVALARKLRLNGMLGEMEEGEKCQEVPGYRGQGPALDMALMHNSLNIHQQEGMFGRPRNHSFPDYANQSPATGVNNNNKCLSGFSHYMPGLPANHLINSNPNRNPYGPSAESLMDCPSRSTFYQSRPPPPVNPYAASGSSNISAGATTHSSGRYMPANNNLNRGAYGAGRPPAAAGHRTSYLPSRSNDAPRVSTSNNPFTHPPPTIDFFAQADAVDLQQELEIVRSIGEYGATTGQFNMPQGLCLGADDEIIVADTFNHRIQFFDKSGDFMFLWGCPGVLNGHLWHPRKVAYIPETEHVVVSDRVNSCSRIQIFHRTGKFLRALGNVHGLRMALNTTTAGLTVYKKQIIVVEVQPSACVMLNEDGSVVHWFSLDGVMVEPSDIVVIEQHFYISDFRDHCVCVFNNWGHLIQRLGGAAEGVIRYPRGLGVSSRGHLLVADTDRNRFHISVWDADQATLLTYHALNDVKFSHSCSVVMNSDGQLVTAVKKDHMVMMMKMNGNQWTPRGDSLRQSAWNVNAPTFRSRLEQVA